MLNLIPKEEKKKIIKGFYYRLVVLFFITIGFITLIAVVLILPSHFLSSVKNNIITAKLEEQKRKPMPLPDQETLAVIKDLNAKLSLIEQEANDDFTVSKNAISAIILKKIPSVKITSFTYDNSASVNGKIGIEGTAPSREVLLLFRKALENDANFEQVDLPISNFIKGQNIQFYLSLIPRLNDDLVGQAK